MTARRLLTSVFLLSAVLSLAACGDDGEEAGSAATASPPATTSAPDTSASDEPAATGATGTPGATGSGEIDFDDQSGDGSSAVVARVSAPGAGFVVVSVHDRGSVLGWVAVEAGVSDDVRVSLDPALTRDTELDATLYADTDGDGTFDADADLAVADPDRERDGDHDGDADRDRDRDGDHEIVEEDAHYRVQ